MIEEDKFHTVFFFHFGDSFYNFLQVFEDLFGIF